MKKSESGNLNSRSDNSDELLVQVRNKVTKFIVGRIENELDKLTDNLSESNDKTKDTQNLLNQQNVNGNSENHYSQHNWGYQNCYQQYPYTYYYDHQNSYYTDSYETENEGYSNSYVRCDHENQWPRDSSQDNNQNVSHANLIDVLALNNQLYFQNIFLIQEHWLFNFQLHLLNELHQNICGIGNAVDDKDPISPTNLPRGYGGTGILWRKDLNNFINPLDIGNDRICCVELLGSSKLLLVSDYLPCKGSPSDSLEFYNCIDQLREIVQRYSDSHSIIIGGDFNEKILSKIDTRRNKYLVDFLNENRLYTDENGITFVNCNGKGTSTIDFLLFKHECKENVICIETMDNVTTNVSDHYPVKAKVKFTINAKEKSKCSNSKILHMSSKTLVENGLNTFSSSLKNRYEVDFAFQNMNSDTLYRTEDNILIGWKHHFKNLTKNSIHEHFDNKYQQKVEQEYIDIIVELCFSTKIRINPDIIKYQNPLQRGFTRRTAPLNCSFIIEEFHKGCVELNDQTTITMLDAKSAFDAVKHAGLVRRLYQMKIPEQSILIIDNLYKNAVSCVSWNNEISDTFRIEQGVRQEKKPGATCYIPGENVECVPNASCKEEQSRFKCTCSNHYFEDEGLCDKRRPAVTPPKVRDSSENHSSRKNSSVECSEPEDEDGDMDSIFQQPSTSSSSACSVTMVPATVKLIADSKIEKDTSLPQMTHISRAERKKTDERTRKDQNDPECRKKQGTSGKIRKSDESLMAMLKEQQKEFLSNESKRWEEEKAREEKMRKEDKEHEMKLFSMLTTILKGQPSSQITSCHASSVSSFPSSSFQDSTFQASPLHSTSTSSTYHRPTSIINNASFLPEASCSNMSFLRMLNNDDCF
ncbi:unnamed protein product [Mytilus coruscus]|uniref:Endonuclease/exonuclease/phosphatase domain-containing protein n=1 Tax=Mytilus coruscus TaxID=42192 RepID=A0A6J8EE43_MYTCO|nr:unnamed protein product [Mytilus coruscus]